jgi:hypothetical protein
MTSLGLLQYSEINENSSMNSNSNLTEIEKKRQIRHNITVKKRQYGLPEDDSSSTDNAGRKEDGPDSQANVQNMLKLINNTNGYDNEDSSAGLADFNPPPRAEVSSKLTSGLSEQKASAPAQRAQPKIDYEKPTTVVNTTSNTDNSNSLLYNQATAVNPRQYPVPLDTQEGFGSLPKTYASDFYKQYVPYFNQTSNQPNVNNRDQLLEKLNYMIHLLEEQKDEKTGHVMEEVILYSFLGVFIIFIVDSFARAGKYTR